MSERRRFNRVGERAALYLAADGKCERCGAALQPGWHADHDVPFSRGGPTDPINGRALCPACNQRKGASMTSTSSPLPLRAWQEAALERIRSHDAPDFLVVACPAAGKTRLANEVIREKLELGRARNVIVVCPTTNLKKQWARAAAAVGVQLEPGFANRDGGPAADFHGVVATYQQVAANPELFRRLTADPTIVVLDELHHAGDDKSWGQAIARAFERAVFRLALSGTPFRSDDTPIAFLRYDDQGVCVADYTYGYGQALTADPPVVRQVLFPRYGGRAEWASNGLTVSATFEEELDQQGESRRLRTALDAGSNFVTTLLNDAHQRLTEIRTDPEGDPRAGGLVIAMDRWHARGLAEQLRRTTGSMPAVALSDDPEASDKIDQFACGNSEWLVAVRMVSEGVDIPRLRVLAYLTNVCTAMYFRQAVGRVVRWAGDSEDQTAFVYIPDDSRLKQLAQEIKNERDDALKEAAERAIHDETRLFDTTNYDGGSAFAPLSASGQHVGDTYDGEHASADQLRQVERFRREAGLPATVPAALLLKFAQLFGPSTGPAPAASGTTGMPAAPPKFETSAQLRKLNNNAARRIAMAGEIEYAFVNAELNKFVGIVRLRDATAEQLQKRLERAQQWLGEVRGG